MQFSRFDAAALDHFVATAHGGHGAWTILTPDDFTRAIAEISGWQGYAPTPLHSLPALAQTLSLGEILYKHEGPRFGIGSFKALGAAYAGLRVLQTELSKRLGRPIWLDTISSGSLAHDASTVTLCSATDGNHGRSLAWGCQRFGAACKIYIHAEVSEGRAQIIRDFGADVIRVAGNYDASVARARADADANGWFMVADTSWPGYRQPPLDVMAGYGLMADEACRAMTTAPTHVILQGGVGGLAAAVAAYLRQYWGDSAPRVVVVEPTLAPCLMASARANTATSVNIASETIMAGLSCGEPSELAWDILADEGRDYLTIPDSIIGPTMRLLARPLGHDPRIEGGESGVAGLAALIAAARQPAHRTALNLGPTSRILVIGSEGITDPAIYADIMEQTD
ncbi:diaminopropionate ammonia-lyase [Pseudorhodobacter ferrugineus]|uniref:diaminopropionate ammonia-lyase n=1 Tax=Pseudorhodobacter ferrugineus TaxID=77008 RepID=UPI0003B57AC3|nr:diaminopropionate ammonia-lyase [Pseudorhodobacter ferrugineus]